MNFSILLYFIVVASAPIALCTKQKADEKMTELFELCRKEVKVTPAEFAAFNEHRMDPARITDNIKCLLKCSLEKLTVLKPDGTIDEALAAQIFNDFEHLKNSKIDIPKVIKTCKDVKGANDCESAHMKLKCLVDEGVLV